MDEIKESLNKTKMYTDKDLQNIYDEKYFATRRLPDLWKRRAEFTIEKFHPIKILDVGSSWGEFVRFLNQGGVDAYGIEGSDYIISKNDPLIKNKIFKVNFNSDKFPFNDKSFDLITGFYSIEHVHNFQFFADEVYRVLKDDGMVWFLTPNSGEEDRNKYDVFSNKYETWKTIFEKHNFLVKKFNPHEMMALKGKLGIFRFYKLPLPLQNIVKRIAYDVANAINMKDASFILLKKP